ncbi:anti-sigma factor [Bacillus sp. 03113]|uniref:anti-sigma factor family protein n=1 Tax=Bacillus sp. 03113 TaxID=2578211 RepID=UPI0015E8A7FD|nr:zf-HC2 domain-containing protein [Bacillus sp. 03113]
MNEHVNQLLSAFIDDELENEQRKKVENHLAICPFCHSEYMELEAIRKELFSFYQSIEVPDYHFEKAVNEKLNRSSFSYQKITWLMTFLASFLVFMLYMKFGTTLYAGITFTSAFVGVCISFFHVLVSILATIPFLLEILIITLIIVVGITLWSVQYLIRIKHPLNKERYE